MVGGMARAEWLEFEGLKKKEGGHFYWALLRGRH